MGAYVLKGRYLSSFCARFEVFVAISFTAFAIRSSRASASSSKTSPKEPYTAYRDRSSTCSLTDRSHQCAHAFHTAKESVECGSRGVSFKKHSSP